jgi:hypothetical protein
MGEARRRGRAEADLVVVVHRHAAKGFTPPRHAMGAVEAAAMFEARGMTSPDKHDLLMVPFGDRVAVAEIGVNEAGRAETRAGESTMALARHMLSTLPAGHNLGIVSVTLGRDYQCDEFLAFVREQSIAKGFSFTTMHGPLTSRETFDNVFRALGDVETAGSA